QAAAAALKAAAPSVAAPATETAARPMAWALIPACAAVDRPPTTETPAALPAADHPEARVVVPAVVPVVEVPAAPVAELRVEPVAAIPADAPVGAPAVNDHGRSGTPARHP